MNKYIKYLFCLLLASGFFKTFSQNVRVSAVMDTSKIRIGEQVKIDLYITHKATQKNLKIQWPRISDTLRKEVEVVNISRIDTTIPDKSRPDEVEEHESVTITSTDSGFWALEPFSFVINDDTANPLSTEPLLLEVQNIPVDTAQASIKDIKTTFEEPFDWHEYLPYIYWTAAALAIVIVIVLLVYKYGKKGKVVVKDTKPKEPPHITALAALEEIRQKKLWQEGKFKEYHTLISDALRMYIEGRYGVAAMELTSEEIFKIMNGQVIDTISKEKLRQILTLADYVKFAKVVPIDVENELSLSNAFDFVNGTKREDEEIEKPEISAN
ncbi:MAG TPA: hypothetical protein VNZ49_15380 [Bacteroidia bacterium]|jgi:hypothetical protein|nr:hypothetical protein [Bacteroidia bacterium]